MKRANLPTNSFFTRLRNTITNGDLKENIFFLHVPKCGGRSIETAFRSCFLTLDLRKDRYLIRHDSQASARVGNILYGIDYTHGTASDYQEVKFREGQLAYYLSLKNVRFISGHLPFNVNVYNEFSDKFKYITILRNPVKRWISHYLYLKYRQSDRWIIKDNLIDYIKTDRAISVGHDYVKYLGGARKNSDYSSIEAIDFAKSNLHKFELLGLLENLDSFKESFRERFGIRLKIGTKNTSPASKSTLKSEITEEAIKMIEEICRPDMEIYNYAKNNILCIEE